MLGGAEADMEAVSIDYGVMEKATSLAVVPVDCGWSDIGSFRALGDRVRRDDTGNVVHGRVAALDCNDCVFYAADGHAIGVVGLTGVVVVPTPNATLVGPAARAHDARTLPEPIEK